MELNEHIQKLEAELNILKTIKVINENIQNLHSEIFDYENLGYHINEYKPFLDKYPFGVSFDEINQVEKWGDTKEDEAS